MTNPATTSTPPEVTHDETPYEERYDIALANERLAVSLTNFQQSW